MESPIWEDIWRSNYPISISMFKWSFLHNFIHVDVKLQEMGFNLASRCQCCRATESVEHLFTGSVVAKEVWRLVNRWCNLPDVRYMGVRAVFNLWRHSMPHINKGHIRCLIPMITLRQIWTARNESKHNGIKMKATRIVSNIAKKIHLLCDGKVIQGKHCVKDASFREIFRVEDCSKVQRSPIVFFWHCPEVGWTKLNSDGSSKGNPGEACAGGILRDHEGKLIKAFYKYLGIQTSFMAELMALHVGIAKCVELRINKVWIEIDSITLCKLINSDSLPPWIYVDIVGSIRKMLCGMTWKCTHIWREGNAAADLLANLGLSAPPSPGWSGITPFNQLNGIIVLDQWGTHYIRRSM